MLDEEDFKDGGEEELERNDLQEVNQNILDELAEFGVDKGLIQGHYLTRKNPLFMNNEPSSKTIQVIQLVLEIIRKNEKMVIVSDWVHYLKMIGERLEEMDEIRGKIGFYTGKMSTEKREDNVRAFNKDEDMMILLLSLKAGGQGLNLERANHVLILDVHWNPQLGIQAEDRVHRIGQMKNVFIYNFVSEDTIEERILQLQGEKLKMAEDVLSGGCINLLEALNSLFNLGAKGGLRV